MEDKPVAQLISLTKKIGNTTIIDDVTLDIYPGEVFGFLGPNGAGKTTTIRMLVGLMKMSAGEVLINGYSIKNDFEKAIAHVGGIIENPEMYKFLSGYDNLIHYARMLPKKVSKKRIDDIVRLVGLEGRINEKVGKYSLGMRQRLGLAQALLHSPSLLILDEPTNGLDPAGIREIRNYIRKIAHEEQLAVFVSSHMLSEMQLMCDRIGIIQKGKLISVETVENFVDVKKDVKTSFDIDRLDEALQFVQDKFPATKPIINKGLLQIQIVRDQIPSMTESLIQVGFKIYGISSDKKTLEDKFLEITEE
ncbi:ABC transporter ATP-binding protein [Bacillus sp. FJAT-45350]|uniref:ABC transporter ATP-binding protein n=1 Tax=Bacillus sp. FJAT-45350 TaxID=2011014 RepID=UPI000BB7DED9|nr:ABC transporter ATP-binding protein [Bacillus sp. FJAT-45350]